MCSRGSDWRVNRARFHTVTISDTEANIPDLSFSSYGVVALGEELLASPTTRLALAVEMFQQRAVAFSSNIPYLELVGWSSPAC